MTYRYFNPDGDQVDSNYNYYKSLKLDDDAYTPIETVPYKSLYIEGIELYTDKNWDKAIEKFEESLEDLYSKLDECYIMCDAFNNAKNLDMSEYYGLLSGLFISSLKCHTECLDRLDFFRVDPTDNLLSSHYGYMQFTYYQRELSWHSIMNHCLL